MATTGVGSNASGSSVLASREMRPERSGWRDIKLKELHLSWGYDVPAVDIDHLLVEYDDLIPVAMIDYKHEFAAPHRPSEPSFHAIKKIGIQGTDGSFKALPFFIVRYGKDYSWWTVVPMNQAARELLPDRVTYDQAAYVQFMYSLRGRDGEAPPRVAAQRTGPIRA